MQGHTNRQMTLGADAGYDDGGFLIKLESCGIDPHVPIRQGEIIAEDAKGDACRRARQRSDHECYIVSQRVRKRIEQVCDWCKTAGGLARTRFIGRDRIEMNARITTSAYNRFRMTHLVET